MKKLLSLLVCFLTFIGAYAVEPVPVFEIQEQGYNLLLQQGINADGQYVFVNVEKQGNDAKYTIYKTDFSVDRTFTIKDGYTHVEGMVYEPPYPDYTQPSMLSSMDDYRNMGVYAIQGLGADRDKWFVFTISKTNARLVEIGVGQYWEYDSSYIIYDESGNKIWDTSSREDTDGAGLHYYLNSLGNVYLVTSTRTGSSAPGGDYYNQFWDLSGNSAVNAPMTVKRTSRAYPNPLHQGRQFTIELSEAAPEGTTVVVSDMNGAAIFSTPVLTGSEKVVIPSRELRDGNLVYSVMANGAVLEKGKIIVR